MSLDGLWGAAHAFKCRLLRDGGRLRLGRLRAEVKNC